MALIDSEEGARRLARAIAADIRLYNAERLARGEPLESELDEGRALFRGRVVEELHPLIETALAEAHLTRKGPSAGTLAPVETEAPRDALPDGLFQSASKPEPARGRSALLLAILLIAGVIGWWLAVR